jgi:ribosomal protein L22
VVSDGLRRLKSLKLPKVRMKGRFLRDVLIKGLLGRWPEKSVKFILRLLKNAESNADAKNIDVDDLYIKNVVVQQAPVRLRYPRFGVQYT